MTNPSQAASSGETGSGLTRLDLVKHAMKTTIEFLRPRDYLVVITFSNTADIALAFTQMDDIGKAAARSVVHSLRASGGTHLWDGLQTAIGIATQMSARSSLNVAIVLQTDGEPTIEYSPPRGIQAALAMKLAATNKPFSIHTCGYGYGNDLDSRLLCDIAVMGNGSYSYIPDGSMLGTVFIHLVTGLMATSLNNVRLPWGGEIIQVPVLRPGQPKSFISTSAYPDQSLVDRYVPDIVLMITMGAEVDPKNNDTVVRDAYLRCLKQKMDCESMEQGVQGWLVDLLRESQTPWSTLLLEDVTANGDSSKGQVEKAFRFWTTWGKHYLPSVYFAHKRQEKMNFKDKSMEIYSTPLLEEMISKAEAMFVNLPPPRSSIVGHMVDMRTMINPNGGCITGDSRFVMEDRFATKRVDEMRKGDTLFGGCKVVCVVKMQGGFLCKRLEKDLCVTMHHPVRFNGRKWSFPIDEVFYSDEVASVVYNLVLDSGHCVVTHDGTECITLGHGIENDPVATHPYYGTARAIADLQAQPGFEDGMVHVLEYSTDVDPETGMVCGMKMKCRGGL